MFSSQLMHQTITKRTMWTLLINLGRINGSPDLSKFDADRMVVEPWFVGVRIVLRREAESVIHKVSRGFSTIVSWWDAAKAALGESWKKSSQIKALHHKGNSFLVESFQDKSEKHKVYAYPDFLQCDCMKFKCINKRMMHEAPRLVDALKKSKIWGVKIEEIATTQGFCHHTLAVMRQMFQAGSLAEYMEVYESKLQEIKTQEAKESLFPPNDWGALKIR